MSRLFAFLLIFSLLAGCGGSGAPLEQENPDPPPGVKPTIEGSSKKGLEPN